MAQSTAAEDDGYLSVAKLQTQLSDYRTSKRAERDEGDLSDRYYHGDQWTSDEVQKLNDRRQPIITYNRCQRKIDGIVGLIERLKQDPKAYPRTPPKPSAPQMPQQAPGTPPMGHNGGPPMQGQPEAPDGAEVATTVLNYVLDSNRWKDISPEIARDAAIGPVGGVELDLIDGDEGDPDIGVYPLDRRGFFYDPRSRRLDFSDARYMGVAKWTDLDLAIEMFPDKEEELRKLATSGESNQGSEEVGNNGQNRAFIVSNERSVYLAEHYYIRRGVWRVCCYAGSVMLLQADSPYPDSFGKGKNGPRYIAFSANIDHDGDRYGFIRNLKGPQDEINHRRSRGVHALNTKRLVITGGTVHNPEEIRAEYHLPDGVVVLPVGAEVKVEDNAALAQGNLEMLTEAKNEIENFGPNPELIGQSSDAKSGRAIALLQQAGIAQLGPFLIAYRAFKTRIYRTVWAMVQQNWTSERWVRVTDDEGLAAFLAVNRQSADEYGRPTLVNVLGSLDVDLILDEGPDQVNSMADAFDTLIALAQQGAQVPPEIILELSSLPGSVKKQILGKLEQAKAPNPMAEQAAQIQMAGEAAKVDLTKAQTMKAAADAQRAGPQPEMVDPEARAYDLADKAAGIDLKRAQAIKTQAEAGKAHAQPQIEAQRTNDQRATEANRTMLELAKLEQQAVIAERGSVEREYASRGND